MADQEKETKKSSYVGEKEKSAASGGKTEKGESVAAERRGGGAKDAAERKRSCGRGCSASGKKKESDAEEKKSGAMDEKRGERKEKNASSDEKKRTEERKQKERSAAKKRVELALKKEERKAEKQRRKAEKAGKKAAAKEKRKEMRLKRRAERKAAKLSREHESKAQKRGDKARRKKLRLERKAKRDERKAAQRAEKTRLKEKRKSAKKVAKEKRLSEGKRAALERKREKRAQKHALKMQRREAALKRKQERAQSRERRKTGGHAPGFGGWLAAVISLGVVTLALGSIVGVGAVRMSSSAAERAGTYRGALYDLTGTLSMMDDDLSKARVSSGVRMQEDVLTDLLLRARLAENTLEKIPVDGEADVNTTSFLNRTGDTAERLLQKLRAGRELSAEDLAALERAYVVNGKILAEFAALTEGLSDKDVAAFMHGKEGNRVYESFQKAENYALEDMPFPYGVTADNMKKDRGMYENNGSFISSEEARKACERCFLAYDIKETEYAGETVARGLDAYNFVLTDKDGRKLYAEIGKRDGALIGFDYYADCSQVNFDLENALTIAENYLETLGYENMTAVWVNESGVNATFLFVYEEQGVAYYPDAVNVKVCKERGKVVGLAASDFLRRHRERTVPVAKVSADVAEGKLNEKLDVLSSRKAVIALGGRETLCYEFICRCGEDEYFVYADAATGDAVKIVRVLETAQGRYLR